MLNGGLSLCPVHEISVHCPAEEIAVTNLRLLDVVNVVQVMTDVEADEQGWREIGTTSKLRLNRFYSKWGGFPAFLQILESNR